MQVDWESWENTDSDGRDEHQECEIEISTVGRAERGEAREEWTAGGTDEEGQDRGVRQGEYIIMLVRGDKERGEKMRSDGLENGHLLALTVWYNTIWLVMIGGREEKHAHVALLYLEKIENSVWRKLSKESSAMHTQHLKEVTPDWNSLQCCQWGVCRYKTTEQTTCNEWQERSVLSFTFILRPISAEMKEQSRGLRTPRFLFDVPLTCRVAPLRIRF